VNALWRTLLALFVATAFARRDHVVRVRTETSASGVDGHDEAELGDDFAYDVAARFNEALIANIDATDNALMAIFAGTLALGVFAIDKIRELAPEHGRIVRGFSNRDGVQPKYFIPDFTADPQAATMQAIEELTRSGEANLAVRRSKKIAAVLAILLLLAGAGALTIARVRGEMVP
jgi:hypothetical protein